MQNDMNIEDEKRNRNSFSSQQHSIASRMALIRSNENMNIQFSTFEREKRERMSEIIIVISGPGGWFGFVSFGERIYIEFGS